MQDGGGDAIQGELAGFLILDLFFSGFFGGFFWVFLGKSPTTQNPKLFDFGIFLFLFGVGVFATFLF